MSQSKLEVGQCFKYPGGWGIVISQKRVFTISGDVGGSVYEYKREIQVHIPTGAALLTEKVEPLIEFALTSVAISHNI